MVDSTEMQPSDPSVVLTPEAITRVQEGVATAQQPVVRECIADGLAELSAIAQGTADQRVSGRFRRWMMRRLIKSFFRVRLKILSTFPPGLACLPPIT